MLIIKNHWRSTEVVITGRFRKPLPSQEAREFESHLLRQLTISAFWEVLRAPLKKSKKEREISARFRPPSIRAERRGESVRFGSELPRARRVRQSGFCSKKVRISTRRYRKNNV